MTRGGNPPYEGAPLVGLGLCKSLWRPSKGSKVSSSCEGKLALSYFTCYYACCCCNLPPLTGLQTALLHNQIQHSCPCVYMAQRTPSIEGRGVSKLQYRRYLKILMLSVSLSLHTKKASKVSPERYSNLQYWYLSLDTLKSIDPNPVSIELGSLPLH